MKTARIIVVPRRFCAASAMLTAIFLLAGARAWSAGCFPPPAGLVSWWAAEGNVLDSIGTNNGTLVGGVTFGAGEVGQAFNLNGFSQYVDVPDSPALNPTTSITCEAWINPGQFPFSSPIIKKAGIGTANPVAGYALEIGGSQGALFGVYINGGWAIAQYAPVPLNQWSHVAGVYDGTNVSIYMNGVLAVSVAAGPGTITPSPNDLQIGHDPADPDRYFNGLIDEASVYNSALSAAQIQGIYNAGSAGKCMPPPTITSQPLPVTVFQGTTVSFSASAVGSQPLGYQWQENMTNIPAAINPTATNTTLVLTNVQVAQSGNIYSLLVTNTAGYTNSSNAVLTVLSPGSCVPPPPGLVSWWSGENNGVDNVGGNNGTLVGGVTFSNGEVGQAFNFDGVSGTVVVPDSSSLRLTNQLTIEAWINTLTTNGDQAIISKVSITTGNNGYQLDLHGNQLTGAFNTPGDFVWPSYYVQAAIPIVLGTWNHVAWTYDNSAMTLYFNGQPVATNVIGPKTINVTGTYLRISGDDNHVYFDGLIDEVGVYNTALSAAQIQAIYAAGSAGKCAAPPIITAQPQPVTVFEEGTASFSVSAGGSQPLSYQWQENMTNIPAAINPTATNATLVLTNVQVAQSGNIYSVLVANFAGDTNSSNAVLTVLPTGSCLPPPPGLVGWWPGELSGIDIIGTNNGTLIGGVKFTNGEVGRAFHFDGISQYVKIPGASGLNVGQVTIDFWMYSDPANPIGSRSEGLVANDFYGIEVFPGNNLYFYISTNGGASYLQTYDVNPGGVTFPAGQWHHVAATYDGVNMQMYLDGNAVGNPRPASGNISPASSGSFMTLGSENGRSCSCGGRYYQGRLDEVDVFNRALSAAEIQLIYSAGSAGKCKAPLIEAQPQSVISDWGYNINLSVNVAGSGTLAYQWEFNGVPINNATNSTLMLDSLQFTNAGSYTVVISNMYGATTSAPAFLTVNPAGVSLALYPGVSIAGVPGYTYGIQYTTDLSNTNSWFGLTNLTLGESNVIWYDSVPAALPQRYYRVLPGPISIP